MKKGKACVPISGRPLNGVDKLRQQIAEIQKNCKHDFRLVKQPKLKESKVKGVYIAYDASVRLSVPKKMTLRCLNCSEEKEVSVVRICPICLKEDMVDLGLRFHREDYFGTDYLYYSPRLKRCSGCGFRIVLDEWNQ